VRPADATRVAAEASARDPDEITEASQLGKSVTSKSDGKLQRDADRFTASRRPLSRPEPPKPPEPAETFERLGPWEIISKDRTGKRAVARCLNCQRIAQIGIGDGTVASCGCDRAHARDPTAFSEMIFAAELIAARRRHKGAT
jgi:hypothetical protein